MVFFDFQTELERLLEEWQRASLMVNFIYLRLLEQRPFLWSLYIVKRYNLLVAMKFIFSVF